MSNLCDGSNYIINLFNFIKSHESQLANALLAYKGEKGDPETGTNNNASSAANATADSNGSRKSNKPVRLSLTLHHLYFLLDTFNQIGLKAGPLNIRLHDIDQGYSMKSGDGVSASQSEQAYEQQEYVSFLSNNYSTKSKRLSSYSSSINSNDNSSITSISSMRSAISSIWNSMSIGYGNGPFDDNIFDNPMIVNHLRYLFMSFTKLPCLRLSPDSTSKLIKNYQEFPFDTIIPLTVFKSLSILEINSINPKEIFGWNLLAEKLRFLIMKNVDLNGRLDSILIDLLWQDYNGRKNVSPNGTHQKNYQHHHHYTASLPSSLPNSPISVNFEKKKLNKKRHKSFANIRKKKTDGKLDPELKSSKKSLLTESVKPSKTYADEISLMKKSFYQTKWKNLKYLSLTNGNIATIDNLECFAYFENLTSLDLSGNRLTEISPSLKHLACLKSLNLSDNKISTLEGFRHFGENKEITLKHLSLINLKHNEITNLNGLEFLTSLTRIDLSYNRIKYLKDLRPVFLSAIHIEDKCEETGSSRNSGVSFNTLSSKTVTELNGAAGAAAKPSLVISVPPETDSTLLQYSNIDKLDNVQNLHDIIIYRNSSRAKINNIVLVGNPIQTFDKNFRIKLFNLFKVFGWVKEGLRINGSSPSYLESYYLFNDEGNDNVDDFFNSDSHIYLNFEKYLFDNENYFHQLKSGQSIDLFVKEKIDESHNDEATISKQNSVGILKSISNYSLQIFDKTKKDQINEASTIDNKENDDIVQALTNLDIEQTPERKNFPETFDTNPIPVNIQNNKLYFSSRNFGHGHSSSISSIDTIETFSTAASPISVSFQRKSINKIDYTTNINSNNSFTGLTTMATSKSLNNLLNLSQGFETQKSYNGYNIRNNTVFDHRVNHERTKSAISYHSTNTLTE